MIAVESMFCNLSSQEVAEFIRSAQVSVCYASPGVQTEVAKAMAEVAGRLGPEMLSVSLDFDERVIRIGFGTIDGVSLLRSANISIQNCLGLRTGADSSQKCNRVMTRV